ncbi:receptor-like protein EIX2 [Ziziphus jujuba]|uniref:Receptor-like protein EIX2 n=1 Tax=Ziziphus jujuba TaxID=326968 RepID=A0A6P4ACK2_ZIZJJ|nr:receptor-like protein EIX2 [Ziziphus jujuba]
MAPPNLGNLSQLQYLDPGSFVNLNLGSPADSLWVSDLYWLLKLFSLQYLNLGFVNLSKATTHWLQTVNMLPSLLELDLSSCELHSFPHSSPSANFTSLLVLDLGNNQFNSSLILSWWFNITTLTELHFSRSGLRGPILEIQRGSLCNLHTLDLEIYFSLNGDIKRVVDAISRCDTLDVEYNKFFGTIPTWIGQRFPLIRQLRLRHNYLTGNIPQQLCQLIHVHLLDLAENILSGPIPTCLDRMIAFKVLVYYAKKSLAIPLLGHQLYYPGSPLPTKCSLNLVHKDGETTEDDEDGSLSNNFWFYVSMGLGHLWVLGNLWQFSDKKVLERFISSIPGQDKG